MFSLALGLPLQHATVSEAGALCHQPASQRQSLAVMAHSLGCRLVFDALQPDLHPDLALLLQTAVSNSELAVYMLANQVPLIGLGRLGQPRSPVRLSPMRLRWVAVSELDDPLTYELVPYFEGLYLQRCAVEPEADGLRRQTGGASAVLTVAVMTTVSALPTLNKTPRRVRTWCKVWDLMWWMCGCGVHRPSCLV